MVYLHNKFSYYVAVGIIYNYMQNAVNLSPPPPLEKYWVKEVRHQKPVNV